MKTQNNHDSGLEIQRSDFTLSHSKKASLDKYVYTKEWKYKKFNAFIYTYL